MNLSLKALSRADFLRIILIIVMIVISLRLFYLQVIQHGYYMDQANAIQVMPLTIIPDRGELYAFDEGELVPLVKNERVYTVFVDPQTVDDKSKVLQTLRSVAGGEVESEIEKLIEADNKEVRYRVVARNISRKQAEMIQEADLTGVGLQQTNRRFYPEGTMGAQMFGYLNMEGEGQYGIEEALDDRLRGQEGVLETVTDVHQIPLTIGQDNVNIPARDGEDLVLTIDRTIQYKAEELLRAGLKRAQATTGSMIVMDPNNGAVLAMASLPTYDPAKYFEVEDYQVLQNPIVAQPFENGSVIKVLTVAAGLDSGVVTPQTTFNDSTGCTRDPDWPQPICNVEEDPFLPNATMLDTLQYSLNTGVVHVLRQMGGGDINNQAREKLWEYFHSKFRFGKLTGIEQASESAGIMISPREQEGNSIRYANMTFGQGMDQTMVQTTAALSAVVNGGIYYQPHLVAGVVEPNGAITERKPNIISQNVISKRASKEATELIHQGRKQGFFGQFDPDGVKVGGKTGTSQIIDPETGEYTDENSIGTYLGFGGLERPEYVIMVKVDDANVPGYQGTTAAGPIFNDMSNWMIDYLQLEARR